MTIPKKITGVYYQINDDFLIKRILEQIETVDILSSKKLFIFNHIRNRFYLKLYIILAHALSKKGYPSCFLFNDRISYHYPFKPQNFNEQIYFLDKISLKSFEVGTHFPNLIIDKTKISNSLVEEKSKTRILNRYQMTEILHFDWEIDLKNEITKASNINFFPLMA